MKRLHFDMATGSMGPPFFWLGNRMKVETIRPLVGFLTSGGFSYHHGRGVGVGAVVAQVLAEIAGERGRAMGCLGWFNGLVWGEIYSFL